jgi:hypothetical protein
MPRREVFKDACAMKYALLLASLRNLRFWDRSTPPFAVSHDTVFARQIDYRFASSELNKVSHAHPPFSERRRGLRCRARTDTNIDPPTTDRYFGVVSLLTVLGTAIAASLGATYPTLTGVLWLFSQVP